MTLPTYLLEQAIEVHMNHIPSITIQEDIFAMTVTEAMVTVKHQPFSDIRESPYPRIKPTIDMTAAVRPYVIRLANHAVGSGKVSKNHSWNTGGNLDAN